MNNDRWFFDPTRDDIATIRQRVDGRNYEEPDIVKQAIMIAQDAQGDDDTTCPTCGQYVETCTGCGGTTAEHDED